MMKSAEEDKYGFAPNVCLAPQYLSLQSSPAISREASLASAAYYPALLDGTPALESPRIEITAYGQFPDDDGAADDEAERDGLPAAAKRLNSVVTLTLPGVGGVGGVGEAYRDPSCLSPASSVSSRSCQSEASSYESGFSYNYEPSPQNSPWQSPSPSPKGSARPGASPGASPCGSPRPPDEPSAGRPGSRPVSPCGAKRKYSFNGGGGGPARSPSPGPSPRSSPRLSFTEDSWPPSANSAILAAINALSTDGAADLGEAVAVKARRTGPECGGGGDERTSPDPCGEERPRDRDRPPMKKEAYFGGFLDVPQQRYSWPKPYVSPSLPSLPTAPSLPALDWQLPSASGPYSLQMEVQPKSHHRAHYETEGSRGAVKAPGGGHPVVQLRGYASGEPLTLQLFIGTADERLLRPHAFYQVHRITGKTVSTPSHEALRQPNTKVLEIPLLPANDMRATIDCAGILKLRNSDIELRKGETDIGRKNTRPSARPRNCPWWTSRAWRAPPSPPEDKDSGWTDTTFRPTPRWCLWKRPKMGTTFGRRRPEWTATPPSTTCSWWKSRRTASGVSRRRRPSTFTSATARGSAVSTGVSPTCLPRRPP
ncbi:nuclear factor of activated T-cells, cytoplasmic 1-like isoform X2 [Stigmatopora argus]